MSSSRIRCHRGRYEPGRSAGIPETWYLHGPAAVSRVLPVREDARQRGIDKIARLAREPRDLKALWQESTGVLATCVPYYWTPCWYTFDPASLLITSHFHEGMPHFPAGWLADEYYGDDVNKLSDVARSDVGVSTLYEATYGDPTTSPRWRRNMTMGG